MNLQSAAEQILFGENLDDKLIDLSEFDPKSEIKASHRQIIPGRSEAIKFSTEQVKFPRAGSFHLKEKRALALHFFANHELLAIEMMAAALIMFPEVSESFRKNLISTIKDEQKHFLLYRKRMNQLGVDFGDYPLNDFFWRQFASIKTPEEFYALVALTFESANLDFAIFYRDIFKEIEDKECEQIMSIVLEDEIKHVARGRSFLESKVKPLDLWEYYTSLLPEKITPARSKGIKFFDEPRLKAGLSEDFINQQKDYRDQFRVTSRKEWS
jgi:uncharacterized ferritin-like protein (DUF455 family)